MCGLVAVISKRPNFGFSRDECDVFRTMLLVDSLRGEDSTGVFGVTNKGNVMIAKSAEHSGSFIFTEEYKNIERKMFSCGYALVGHNRKATRGSITDENAHPFWVNDEVVLVHNGTFYGDHKHLADTEVDSHALAHTIQKHAVDDVGSAFKKINAAYATIWYDVRDKSINIVRNGARPLYFLSLPTCWILCSEKEMIEFAVKRCKIHMPDTASYGLLKDHVMMKLINVNGSVNLQNIDIPQYQNTNYTPANQRQQQQEPTEFRRRELASAWNALQNDLNVEDAKVIDSVEATSTSTNIIPFVQKQDDPTVSITAVTDKVIKDMPASMYDMLKHDDWSKLREVYQPKTSCYFRASNIVQIRDDLFAVYGPLSIHDNLIGITLLRESDFTKVIDTKKETVQELHGEVESIYYRNIVENGTQQRDWYGYGFVTLNHVQKVEEYAHCSC